MDKETLVTVLTRISEEIDLGDQDPEGGMYSCGYRKCVSDVAFFLSVEIPERE